jgi:hypothetical protein
VAGAAQPTPQTTEAGPCDGPVTAHRAHAVARPPAATRPARRGRVLAGQGLPAGQGGRKWSSPERCSTVEAVVRLGTGMFARVKARGHWRRALTIPADGEGDRGGELHATTEGRRESARGSGYHQSSEERR